MNSAGTSQGSASQIPSNEVEPCPVAECHLPVDIILVSSDGKAISAHKANLGQFSNGFPPFAAPGAPHALMDEGHGSVEQVPLEEKGEVLALLMQYMHHTHLPDLNDLKFDIVAGLAEAAEKYEVFSAIALCKTAMTIYAEQGLSVYWPWGCTDESLVVFFYALKHGYTSIANNAAPKTLSLSLDNFLKKAQTARVNYQDIMQWIHYREFYLKQVRKIWQWCDVPNYNRSKHWYCEPSCGQWATFEHRVMGSLYDGIHLIFDFGTVLTDHSDVDEHNFDPDNFYLMCETCRTRRDAWGDYVEREVIERIPFSSVPV